MIIIREGGGNGVGVGGRLEEGLITMLEREKESRIQITDHYVTLYLNKRKTVKQSLKKTT